MFSDRGYFHIYRVNFDRLTAHCASVKNGKVLFICAVAIANNMTKNNYIKNLNSSVLSNYTNGLISRGTIRNTRVIETMVSINAIAMNDEGACMMNPAFAFACKGTDDAIDGIRHAYEQFKETGKFVPYFKG